MSRVRLAQSARQKSSVPVASSTPGRLSTSNGAPGAYFDAGFNTGLFADSAEAQGQPGSAVNPQKKSIALPRRIAHPFEKSYGASLDRVRIYPDSPIPERFGMDALTVDHDVAFGPGMYQPESLQGQYLLGHELAHVVQQSRSSVGPALQGFNNRLNNAGEQEAHGAALMALTGQPAALSAAPMGPQGGSAGGCFIPGVPSNVVGDRAHNHIQNYYNAIGFYSEVSIPFARYVDRDRPLSTGYADLLFATPPVMPAVPQPRIRPPWYSTCPPSPPPDAALIGEIKPISWIGSPDGYNQVQDYVDAHNAYYGSRFSGSPRGTFLPIAEPMRLPPLPGLAAGDPTFISWPPQVLHVITTFDGVYYYACRPMGELLPIMEYLRERLRDWIRRIEDFIRRFPPMLPKLVPVLEALRQVARTVEEALDSVGEWASDHFWEILAIVAIVIAAAVVIVFASEILAAIAAIGAAIAEAFAAIAEAVAAITALFAEIESLFAAVLALLALFFPSLARAETPPERRPERPKPPHEVPPEHHGPGCFPGKTLVTMGDGTKKRIDTVRVKESVLAYDENTGTLLPCDVTAVFVHPPEPLIEITLEDSRTLAVTHFHAVRSSGEWIMSCDLKPGFTLLLWNEKELEEISIVKITPLIEQTPVYNLRVASCPTYLADDVVVHNTSAIKEGHGPSSQELPVP